MRILVCGGRDYGDLSQIKSQTDPLFPQRKEEYNCVLKALDQISFDYREEGDEPDADGNWLPQVTIISGAARGVDTVALDWAVINWCPSEEYPADWDTHGKAAGPIRNKQMLEEGKPDLVVAFPGG